MTKRPAPAPAVASIGDVVGAARARLDELRRQIAEVQSELDHERARPVTVATAKARIAEAVDRLRREAIDGLHAGYFLAAEQEVTSSLLAELADRRVTVLSMGAALDPAGLTRVLVARMEAAAEGLPDGVDPPERSRRMGALRARLTELERAEADALWAADAAGVSLPWRPDLSPAVLLGLDEAA